jgi:hypothetical protein
MLASVHFQGNFRFRTIEVQRISPNGMFPPEFVTCEPTIPQQSPHPALCFGHLLTQDTSVTHYLH